jgi:hypothetical protein
MVAKSGCPVIGQTQVNSGTTLVDLVVAVDVGLGTRFNGALGVARASV